MNNKIFKYTAGALFVGLAMTACSPDDFNGADQNGIPTVSGEDFELVVDQEVNQIQVSYPEKDGIYPVWIFNGATYSTLNKAGWANTDAGTYTVEMRLGNRNGLSQSTIKKEFTFNETKVNWNNQINRVKDKQWRIDYDEPAHMGCGEYGTDGSGWWAASPGEKKDFGVYDDRITFGSEKSNGGTFTYNPGPDGMTYVNTGTTLWGSETADFDAPTQEQVSGYHFERDTWTDSEGQEISVDYLVLDGNTLFPYISSDDQYANPRFRIETLTATKMVLIYDKPDKSISWRFILTSKDETKAFEGFDANSNFNLWKGITPNMTFYYNPDPNWGNEQTETFASLFEMGNNDYTVTVPNQCYAQWQAQVHFHTNIATQASSNYDFSVILNSDKDCGGVTVKLTDEADGDAFFFAETIDLKAGEDYIFWKSDFPGIDFSQVKLVLDFGWAGDDTHINVRNVVLKDHANDDGTVLPSEEPTPEEPDVPWVDVNSAENLGAGFNTKGEMSFWWATADWQQIADPGFSYANGVYTVTANQGTVSEWQAQCTIGGVPLNIELGQAYDVSVKITTNMPLGRATVKVNKDPDVTNDPNTLCYRGDFSLEDGVNVLKFVNVVAKNGDDLISFDQGKIIFDFGGCPEGFEAKISDIIIQKHQVNENDPANVDWADYKSSDNLGSDFNSIGSMSFWWATADWQQIADPGFSFSNGVYTITANDATVSEWQAQCTINGASMKIEKGQKYDVSVTIEANMDLPRATVKVNKDPDVTNDPNTLCYKGDFSLQDGVNVLQFAGVVAKNGDEEIEFDQAKMIFDFGGCPAGFEAKISKIIIQKHKLK